MAIEELMEFVKDRLDFYNEIELSPYSRGVRDGLEFILNEYEKMTPTELVEEVIKKQQVRHYENTNETDLLVALNVKLDLLSIELADIKVKVSKLIVK